MGLEKAAQRLCHVAVCSGPKLQSSQNTVAEHAREVLRRMYDRSKGPAPSVRPAYSSKRGQQHAMCSRGRQHNKSTHRYTPGKQPMEGEESSGFERAGVVGTTMHTSTRTASGRDGLVKKGHAWTRRTLPATRAVWIHAAWRSVFFARGVGLMLKESSDLSSTVSYFAAAPLDVKVPAAVASKQRTWPTLCVARECF